mgnify:CR=1 FL=1
MNIIKNLFKTTIVFSSGLCSLLVVALPGEAITFARSTSSFSFNNFSQPPSSVSTSADTDTLTLSSGDGTAIAEADAAALFSQDPAFSLNRVVSEALGTGSNYLGIAESQASVLGQFEVLANTSFDFSFIGLLDLFSEVDDPVSEQAQATAGITFALLNEAATVLSSFELFGNLNTPGDGDVLSVDSTPNVNRTIDSSVFSSGPDNLAETASIVVSGNYSQSFVQAQRLTLGEVKASDALVAQTPSVQPPVQTPEPGILLALVSLGGGILGLRQTKNVATR